MFEDAQPKKPGNIPGNLPMGAEPEDMFSASGDAEASPVPAEESAVLSQSVGATSAMDAGLLRPKQSGVPDSPTGGAVPPFSHMPQADDEAYRIKSPAIGRGILLAVIIGVALIIIGGGGWWIYIRYVRVPAQTPDPITFGENQPALSDAIAPPSEEVVAPSDKTGGSLDITTEIIDDTVLFGEPVDSDGDGLDDLREEALATNPNNWDSDGDTLGDREEAISWKTDPNNRDTDGDGFDDGQEVRSGYNPNGSGRYTVPPTTTTP